jgi:type IV pilus assembly protein PilA
MVLAVLPFSFVVRLIGYLRGESMKKEKGFSLIELLIVVAIILIIAAIAIPNLLRSRIAANEASAAGSVRSIVTAETAYFSTYSAGYATLAQLGGAVPCSSSVATACLVDPIVSAGSKSGYVIAAAPLAGGTAYVASAVAQNPQVSGVSTFCSDQTGVVRKDPAGAAAPATDVACEGLPAMQ